ncbi:nuclear transport factor 2 family protein [Listeria booriae]|uniref:nuclear transport factor 2 family protein n=1 Tax=Listeria booriae TaxID=1552123 RepID=UPI0016249C7C|nr:DUF4440 domain-containing protein [Listeria booriae]MBC1226760.1 DUF4440 domain-containing protein [Listeria booriae]
MNQDLKALLQNQEEQLLRPEIRTSKEALNQLLAADFFEFGSSGRVFRGEEIDEKGIGAVDMQLSDFEIKSLAPDVVLATYRIFNVEQKQSSLRSSIWKFQNNRWQLVFHQGTKTI